MDHHRAAPRLAGTDAYGRPHAPRLVGRTERGLERPHVSRLAPPREPDGAPDLIAELEQIAALARNAQRSLDDGRAVNGRSALMRIEYQAADAHRHALEHRRRTTAAELSEALTG